MDQDEEIVGVDNRVLLEKRPGIFVIGSPNVGKRTILSRNSPPLLHTHTHLSSI